MFDDKQYDPVELPLTSEAIVLYVGEYRGLQWEVRYSKMAAGSPTAVCSYIHLTEGQYETFRLKVESAPWNGYISFRRRVTYEYINFNGSDTHTVMGEFAKDTWQRPNSFYKFGDDFQHEWDRDPPNPDCMKRHITDVIDYLYTKDEDTNED